MLGAGRAPACLASTRCGSAGVGSSPILERASASAVGDRAKSEVLNTSPTRRAELDLSKGRTTMSLTRRHIAREGKPTPSARLRRGCCCSSPFTFELAQSPCQVPTHVLNTPGSDNLTQCTCSAPDCQRERHRRSCAAWRQRHPDYAREDRLRRGLQVPKTAAAARWPR